MTWSVVTFGVPESAPMTGGERYLQEICSCLKLNGVSVSNIDLAKLPEWVRRRPLLVNLLLSNFWFLSEFRSLSVDGIVVLLEDFHFHPRLLLVNFLARLRGKEKIVVLFQLSAFYHELLRRRLMRWLDEAIVRLFFCQADLVLTNSISGHNLVLTLGVPAERVKVVYCGYDDLGQVGDGPVMRLGGRGKSQILFVGRINPHKGLEYLLEGMALLGRSDVTLNIVGNVDDDPRYYRYLLEMVDRHNLDRQVVFHGFIADRERLRGFYQEADVFVLPSITEGFGIVLLEAMSMGLPVVATDVEAIPESVKDGETGILVPPRDARSLARALASLLESPSLRQEYGRNAQKHCELARASYSWESVAARVFASVQKVAEA